MTTENKHTPGPWKAEYEEYGEEIWFGGGNCGTWYVGPCYLGGDGDDPEKKVVMDANARLIAAAPDMLEALEWYADDTSSQGDIARAAIAKARGQ